MSHVASLLARMNASAPGAANPLPPILQTPPPADEAPIKPAARIEPLPKWRAASRAIPHAMVRSALFSTSATRRQLVDEPVAAVSGVTVYYSGESLNQYDLDVFAQCVQYARNNDGLGSVATFETAEALKVLGWSPRAMQMLYASLTRLAAGSVKIYDGKHYYVGHLIDAYKGNLETGKHYVRLSPELVDLYVSRHYTVISADVRKALRKPLAKWLYMHFASHTAGDFDTGVRADTLHRLSGSSNASMRSYRQELRAALDEVGGETGWPWSMSDKAPYLVRVQRTTAPYAGPIKPVAALPAVVAQLPLLQAPAPVAELVVEGPAAVERSQEEPAHWSDAEVEAEVAAEEPEPLPYSAPDPRERGYLAEAGITAERYADYIEFLHSLRIVQDYIGVTWLPTGEPLFVCSTGRIIRQSQVEQYTQADLGIDAAWPLPTAKNLVVSRPASVGDTAEPPLLTCRLAAYMRRNAPAVECIAREVNQLCSRGGRTAVLSLFDHVAASKLYMEDEKPECYAHLVEWLAASLASHYDALDLLEQILKFDAFNQIPAARRGAVSARITVAILHASLWQRVSNVLPAADSLVRMGVAQDYAEILRLVAASDIDQDRKACIVDLLEEAVAI